MISLFWRAGERGQVRRQQTKNISQQMKKYIEDFVKFPKLTTKNPCTGLLKFLIKKKYFGNLIEFLFSSRRRRYPQNLLLFVALNNLSKKQQQRFVCFAFCGVGMLVCPLQSKSNA
jgi:hypothetical protein